MVDGYFKKSDVLEAIEKDRQYYLARRQYGAEHWTCKVRDTVEDLPIVRDVREVKHGKWEICVVSPFDGEDVRCSECGQCGCAPYWDFCPNCGSYNGGNNDG